MRFLTFYLIGYFALLFGAAIALWQSGMLDRIPGTWIALGALITVGLGILLVLASRPRLTAGPPPDTN